MIEKAIHFYSDGLRLVGTLYLPDQAPAGERRPTVIACSGYMGLNAIYPRLFAQVLTHAGYAVLGFDYRGNGDSEGVPGRILMEEQWHDIENAITFALVQPEVGGGALALLGWGMGAGNVIQVAAGDERVTAVAALNGFYNGNDFLLSRHGEEGLSALKGQLEQDRVERVLTGKSRFTQPFVVYPLDPDTAKEVDDNLRPVPGFGPNTSFELADSILRFDSEAVVHKIAPRPLFIAHGRANLLHPLDSALAVYGRAGRPKKLLLVEGKHNDFMRLSHPQFVVLMDAFLTWLTTYGRGFKQTAGASS
jgi:fermentation-respiration switch protein FrsA (DUF1100 family)